MHKSSFGHYLQIIFSERAGDLGKQIMARNKEQWIIGVTNSENEDIDQDDNIREEDDDVIKLTDVFKCLHIATLTNDVPNFKENFINDRHNQLKVGL